MAYKFTIGTNKPAGTINFGNATDVVMKDGTVDLSTIAAAAIDTSPADSSSNLIDSNAVYDGLALKLNLGGGALTGALTTNSTIDGVDIATRDGILSSTTTTADAALPKSGGAMTGAITTNSTFDGVDVAACNTLAVAALPKTGGAMTGAITTNSTFDGVDIAVRDAILSSTTTTADAALPKAGGAMTGAITTNSTFDGVDVAACNTLAVAALPKAGGAMTGAITTNSTFDGVDIATRDGVLSSTTTTANAALPKTGGAMTGAITTNSTFDGVDIATRDGVLTSTTNTANAALSRGGGTMTAAIAMGTAKITGLGDPTADQDAATKLYVDGVAAGLDVKATCAAATAGALPAVTYANGTLGVGATLTADADGALTIDGQSAQLAGQRVLIQDQVSAAQNGIYTVTNAGGVSAAFVLTRVTDFDELDEVSGGFTFIVLGTVNANNGFICTAGGSITMGTTALNFAQFSAAGQISAGAGLVKGADNSASSDQLSVDTGIADNKILKINSGTAASGEYCKLTTTGVESRSVAEVAGDIQSSITSVGTLTDFSATGMLKLSLRSIGASGNGGWSGSTPKTFTMDSNDAGNSAYKDYYILSNTHDNNAVISLTEMGGNNTAGRVLVIKNAHASNLLVVDPHANDKIDALADGTSISIEPDGAIQLIADGVGGWFIY